MKSFLECEKTCWKVPLELKKKIVSGHYFTTFLEKQSKFFGKNFWKEWSKFFQFQIFVVSAEKKTRLMTANESSITKKKNHYQKKENTLTMGFLNLDF